MTSTESPVVVDSRAFGRGIAVLRVFVGLIALANGLAKAFGWGSISIGPYVTNLINRDTAEFILRFEVFGNEAGGQRGTRVPGARPVAELLLDNWGFFGWALTVAEVVTGLLLVLGLATRAAALVALGQHLALAVMYATSNRWLFEQPHEYVPLLILALVPAGRVWGLDSAVARRLRREREGRVPWPF